MFTTDAMPTLNAYGAVFTLHETADGSRCLYMAAQPQVRRAGTDLWVDIPAEEIPRGALPLGEVPIRDKDMEEVTLLSSLEDLLTEKEMHDQVQRIVAAWKEGCETLQDATDVHSWDVLRYGEDAHLENLKTLHQRMIVATIQWQQRQVFRSNKSATSHPEPLKKNKPLRMLRDAVTEAQGAKQRAASLEAAFDQVNSQLVRGLCETFAEHPVCAQFTADTDKMELAAKGRRGETSTTMTTKAGSEVDEGLKTVYGMPLDRLSALRTALSPSAMAEAEAKSSRKEWKAFLKLGTSQRYLTEILSWIERKEQTQQEAEKQFEGAATGAMAALRTMQGHIQALERFRLDSTSVSGPGTGSGVDRAPEQEA